MSTNGTNAKADVSHEMYAIAVTPGAATLLGITTQPSASAVSGVAFAQQPALQLIDVAGKAVNQSGVVVTAAVASAGGALAGT